MQKSLKNRKTQKLPVKIKIETYLQITDDRLITNQT